MYPFPHHLLFKKVVQGYLFILIGDIYLLFILFLLLFLLLLFLLLLLLLLLFLLTVIHVCLSVQLSLAA